MVVLLLIGKKDFSTTKSDCNLRLIESNFQFDSVSDYGDNWNQVYGFKAEPALLQDLLYLLEYLGFYSFSATFIAISQHLYSPRYVKASFEVVRFSHFEISLAYLVG